MERVIFNTKAELDAMTKEQARLVLIAAADNMRSQLEPTPYSNSGPYHFLWSDDGLDDMDAASTFWHKIFGLHLEYDGQWQEEEPRLQLAKYLFMETQQAADGEMRYHIFGTELRREMGWNVDDDEEG